MQESKVRLSLIISQKNEALSELRATHADLISEIHNLQDTKERVRARVLHSMSLLSGSVCFILKYCTLNSLS